MDRRKDTKTHREMVRRHVWLYEDDWDWLEAQFGDNVKPSKAIREIVSTAVQNMKAKADAAARAIPASERDSIPVDGSEPK